MMSIIYPMLPVLLTTVLMIFKQSKNKAVLYGICLGILQYFIQDGDTLNKIKEAILTVFGTAKSNLSIVVSIFLLFVLVNLIESSKSIAILNFSFMHYICSPSKVIIFLIILGSIFSLDDYLLCVATAAIITTIANKHGFSNEKTAYLINITAVSCCCISPFSSWMPVIKSSISAAGLSETTIYQVIPFNYGAILGIFFIFVVGLKRPYAFHSKPGSHVQSPNLFQRSDEKQTTYNIVQILAVCSVFAILIGSFILLTFIFHSSYVTIKTTLISIIAAILIFISTDLIETNKFSTIIKEAYRSTTNLCLFLIPLWTLANICNYLLGLSENIANLILDVHIPVTLLPVIIYCTSAAFSFFIGSAYGTFSLFIPIAIQISNNSSLGCIRLITVAAAISGALQAASSFGSDTMELSAEKTNSSLESLKYIQLPYAIAQFCLCAAAFLISGLSSIYGTVAAFILPLFIISAILLYYIVIWPTIYNIIYINPIKLLTCSILFLHNTQTNKYFIYKQHYNPIWILQKLIEKKLMYLILTNQYHRKILE